MKSARAGAAGRLRGGFVGAVSASVAVAAHAVGGGMLPGGGAIALLMLVCAAVGTVAATSAPSAGSGSSLFGTIGYLCIGQGVGHATLALASGHLHLISPSAPMLLAHLLASVLAAVMICAAERFGAKLASRVRWLVTRTPAQPTAGWRPAPDWAYVAPAALLLNLSGPVTRGPPGTVIA